MAMDTDDFLAHYGVKGMKWGRRKSSGSSSSSKPGAKPGGSKPAAKTAKQIARKKARKKAFSAAVQAGTVMAVFYGPQIADLTMKTLTTAALSKQKHDAGKAASRDMFKGIGDGIPGGRNLKTAKSRGGAYNVRSKW